MKFKKRVDFLPPGTWFNYMVRCADGSLYSGVTNNVFRRMREHFSGKGSKYVRSKLPAHLAWACAASSKSKAYKLEYEIKALSKVQKEEIVSDFNPALQFWTEHNITPGQIAKDHDLTDRFSRLYDLRLDAVDRWTWAIPNEEALSELVLASPLVEVGAGTGYWASLLRAMGADVVAYDIRPPGLGIPNVWHIGSTEVHCAIKVGDETSASYHPDRSLLLCWPPRGDMALRCASQWKGKKLFFVGEPNFETCGSPDLHVFLVENFTMKKVISIPQWTGLNDVMMVFERS